MITACDQMLYI